MMGHHRHYCRACGDQVRIFRNAIEIHCVPGTHFRCPASGCPWDMRASVIDRYNVNFPAHG